MTKEITARLEEIKKIIDWDESLLGVDIPATRKDFLWVIDQLEASLKREAELVAALGRIEQFESLPLNDKDGPLKKHNVMAMFAREALYNRASQAGKDEE